MNQHSKLTAGQKAEEQQLETAQQQSQPQPLEFATPEELLRHDALHTPVPPSVTERLEKSLSEEPPPKEALPWWKRLFGEQKP